MVITKDVDFNLSWHDDSRTRISEYPATSGSGSRGGDGVGSDGIGGGNRGIGGGSRGIGAGGGIGDAGPGSGYVEMDPVVKSVPPGWRGGSENGNGDAKGIPPPPGGFATLPPLPAPTPPLFSGARPGRGAAGAGGRGEGYVGEDRRGVMGISPV